MVSAGTQACREDAAHRSCTDDDNVGSHRAHLARLGPPPDAICGRLTPTRSRAAYARRRRRRASRAGRARVKGVSRCGALGTRSATTARRRDAAPALSAISALSTVAVAWPPVHELVHELQYADVAHTHLIIGSARSIPGILAMHASAFRLRIRRFKKVWGSNPFGCTTVIPTAPARPEPSTGSGLWFMSAGTARGRSWSAGVIRPGITTTTCRLPPHVADPNGPTLEETC